MRIQRQQLQNTGGEFTETATQTQWYSRVHICSYVIQHHSPQVLQHGTFVHVQDNMRAHPDLCNSYILEGIAQVQFFTTQNLVYICLNMYVYKSGPSWNSNSKTPEPDQPQHDCLIACVITQQYSSATCLCTSITQRKIPFLLFLKIVYVWNCIHQGMSVRQRVERKQRESICQNACKMHIL